MKKIYFFGFAGAGIITLVLYLLLIPSVESISRYEAIPEKPDDFTAYSREIWSGGLTDLCSLDDAYWKQPEFYGDSWKNAREKFYDNPNYKLWGVYGQGNIPMKMGYTFTNFKEGDEFELCTFFHNGFGLWTYQGFKLIPQENEYFKVIITPDELTLSPTFPVFEDGWANKIKVKIIVKKTPPIGTYEIGFDVAPPSQEYSSKKTKEVLEMKIEKSEYLKDCIDFLKDEERCTELINGREKKYVAGGTYKASVLPFALQIRIQ